MADTADVTIVVVPRERFSRSVASLESIYRNTPQPFKLIYVDGNSPRHVRRYLEAQAIARGFKLLRTDHYLVPNHARNLGTAHADTEYIVFLDNDVLVTPGWVFHLLTCAKETGAWLVIPLYLEGQPEDGVVHMAGGIARLEAAHGRRVFKNAHRFFGRAVDEVRDQLKREPTGSVEYHCLLARRDVFSKVGPFDEQLPSLWEHTDLALAVQEAGGAIYFEPSAVVSYDSSGRLKWYDFPYFAKRWSDEWGRISIDRFRRKWELSEDDPDVKRMYHYSAAYRRHFLRRWFPIHPRLFGHNLTTPAVVLMDRTLQFCFGREWGMPVQGPAPARV
jgi:GT2 family glycosyltransferase